MQMEFPAEVRFPCKKLPEDARHARLLGVYPQRPEGLLMQRVKLPEGRIQHKQWSGLAALANELTPEYPLHVTTRQDLELHGVRIEDVPAVQRRIHDLGLTGIAACGDSVRNITVCPDNGLRRGTWNVSALADAIRTCVQSLPWAMGLPRKFKISISACPQACARPWINDLGLAANADGTLRVMLAGSLGPKPQAGLLFAESLATGEVLPLLVALLRLFHAEGDRANRGRARLRHLRQRLGDDVFRRRVEELFQEEKSRQSWPEPSLHRVEFDVPLRARFHLPLGDISPEAALELGNVVAEAKAELRLGLDHDLLVAGGAPLNLAPRLAALCHAPAVMACPGVTWCTRGIADSRAAAGRILAALPNHPDLLIGVAGCPNNCPLAAVADIGLIGRLKRSGGQTVESFRLVAGGGRGQTPLLASELHAAVPAEKVGEAVALVAQDYPQCSDRLDQLAAELRRRYGEK